MHPAKTNLPLHVEKYLVKYSLNGWNAEIRENKKFNNIAVIPAIKEYKNLKKLIESLNGCDSRFFNETLFLFVINNTVSADPEAKEDNLDSINYLRSLIISSSPLNTGLIDASTEGKELPEKDGGVGLARKIGMDTALSLFDYNNSRKKILICLDADCTVESNYLTAIVSEFNNNNYEAAYVNFRHPLPDDTESRLAIICYEIFLRYYVLGLMYAGSEYAIHTIGSTMICSCESYIKVEGMNKKKAAEDFYFMEKLCKNYDIHKIETTTIYPSSRGSWRVPFGTGQRVNRYLSKTHEEYLLYSPESFEVLKRWLEIFNSDKKYSPQEYLSLAENIHPGLKQFLVENKFEENWSRIVENGKNDSQLRKQKHFWFDGFRTLKLIHYLRDNGIPQIEMYTAVEKMLNKFDRSTGAEIGNNYKDTIDKQIVYLNLLREIA